jgi:hypothetical protein
VKKPLQNQETASTIASHKIMPDAGVKSWHLRASSKKYFCPPHLSATATTFDGIAESLLSFALIR